MHQETNPLPLTWPCQVVFTQSRWVYVPLPQSLGTVSSLPHLDTQGCSQCRPDLAPQIPPVS